MTVEKQHIDKRTLAIHILCWGFLVFVPSILRPSDSFDERIFHTLRSLGPSLCYMAVFYLNYLYLVPKIFLKHRRSTFIWVNIVLIVTYFFLAVAELFISPLGLSFVSKIAPQHLQGICQGLWLCATAIGNLFIALGVTMLNSFPHQWECWAVFAGFCLLSMGVMLGMLKWLERVTQK